MAFTAIGFAQDFRATISGLVTDQNRQAVADAIVKAVNVIRMKTKEVRTTSEGRYSIPYLNPAIYNIEVTANGFQTLKREGITLRIADKLDLPLQLTVGQVSETVVVAGQQETLRLRLGGPWPRLRSGQDSRTPAQRPPDVHALS